MRRVKTFRWGVWLGRYVVAPLVAIIIVASLLGMLAVAGLFFARTLGL